MNRPPRKSPIRELSFLVLLGIMLTAFSVHHRILIPSQDASSLVINPPRLSFGSIPVGGSGIQSFRLTNTSRRTINQVNVANLGGPFQMLSKKCDGISPGETCEVEIRFSPKLSADFVRVLQIKNGPNTVPLTISGAGGQ